MARGPEEGLWPWAHRCPGCATVNDSASHRVRLAIVFDGVEVFELDVWLCDHHYKAMASDPSDERSVARAEVEGPIGIRWDSHAKPAMDAIVIGAGAPPLPWWKEAEVKWPGEVIGG